MTTDNNHYLRELTKMMRCGTRNKQQMMDMELKKVRLGEIATIVNGATPSTTDPCNYDGDIVWITPKDLSDQKSKYIKEGSRNITQKGFDSCSAQLIPPLNILMSSRAPIGLLAINEVECCTNQGFKNIIVDKSICDADYMFYYLHYHMAEVQALGSGTTFKEVSKSSLERLSVTLPNLSVQRKIGKLLSDIDRKIALNRRMNATLEAMARQLYDYWFLQFDFPDADGKPYKSSGGKMTWNDKLKREIPEGWEVEKLKDKCKIVIGGTPSTTNKSFWEKGTVNWLNSAEVAEFPIVTSEKKITEDALKASATEYAPKGSVTLSITRYLRPSILCIDACINQSVVAIFENETLKKEFIYQYISHEIPRYMKLRTGAQQPHINKEIVEHTNVMLPPKDLLSMYQEACSPIYESITNNAQEILWLTRLRTTLLPLLMNGQVSVDECAGLS